MIEGAAGKLASQACTGRLLVPHRASMLKRRLLANKQRSGGLPSLLPGRDDPGNFPAWPGTPFPYPRGRTVAWSALSVPGGVDIVI